MTSRKHHIQKCMCDCNYGFRRRKLQFFIFHPAREVTASFPAREVTASFPAREATASFTGGEAPVSSFPARVTASAGTERKESQMAGPASQGFFNPGNYRPTSAVGHKGLQPQQTLAPRCGVNAWPNPASTLLSSLSLSLSLSATILVK